MVRALGRDTLAEKSTSCHRYVRPRSLRDLNWSRFGLWLTVAGNPALLLRRLPLLPYCGARIFKAFSRSLQ